jgi:hypothetical protein
MKSLFAFSSGGGGGSGFPGAPIAGVYTTATAPEFLSVCAEVLAVQFSTVVDAAAGGLAWYSNVTEMILLGGSVLDSSEFPTPGTAGGVTFVIGSEVAIYNQDTGNFYYYDGADWVSLA